jgi:hypothetical protein
MGSPKCREKMAGYKELWITGSREILRIAWIRYPDLIWRSEG